MEKKIYTINADGKKLGRIATEATALLIGKNRVDYARNVVFNVEVKIENAGKARYFRRKIKNSLQKVFRFSRRTL